MPFRTLTARWPQSLVRLFFPHECIVCHAPLHDDEHCLCTACHAGLPRTNYHLRKENRVERLFWGKIPLERATSFFFYKKGSDYHRILYRLKYRGEKQVGFYMGRYMAAELLPAGFFRDMEVILPVPLHARREKERGYNQSEWIAKGIASLTGLPVAHRAMMRRVYTETQTHQTLLERWENVEGIFELCEPERLQGKHVLLVDDVLTTGSTLTACATPLTALKGVRLSILTLAVAAE